MSGCRCVGDEGRERKILFPQQVFDFRFSLQNLDKKQNARVRVQNKARNDHDHEIKPTTGWQQQYDDPARYQYHKPRQCRINAAPRPRWWRWCFPFITLLESYVSLFKKTIKRDMGRPGGRGNGELLIFVLIIVSSTGCEAYADHCIAAYVSVQHQRRRAPSFDEICSSEWSEKYIVRQ